MSPFKRRRNRRADSGETWGSGILRNAAAGNVDRKIQDMTKCQSLKIHKRNRAPWMCFTMKATIANTNCNPAITLYLKCPNLVSTIRNLDVSNYGILHCQTPRGWNCIHPCAVLSDMLPVIQDNGLVKRNDSTIKKEDSEIVPCFQEISVEQRYPVTQIH